MVLSYGEFRHNVCANKIHAVNDMWLAAWLMFIATKKVWYARLSLYVQHVLHHAHPTIINVLNNRLVSLRGENNRYMGADLVIEKQNRYGRYHL
jgi:hypothetical protein